MRASFCRFHPIAVLLMALAWSGFAFCGEIHDAAKDGNLEKVKALVQANPKLVSSKDDDGRTPLHWAAVSGHKDVVQFLLDHKADVRAKDNDGKTAFQLASFNKDVAELLQEHGGRKTTASHDPAIFDAAANGELDKVKELVEDDPDIVFFECKTNGAPGTTALGYAVINDHKAVVEFLLDHKADINAKDLDNQTPLMGAAMYDRKDMVELLIARGVDVNAIDINTVLDKDKVHGGTALHCAAFFGFNDVAQVLLDAKADVNIVDQHGHTALGVAEMKGHKETVELLRKYGGHE